MNAMRPEQSQQLVSVLQLAERLLHKLVHPEKIYFLKFGESDERIHFHVVPRTTALLKAYLDERQDSPPYNGALITAWLWANSQRLGHCEADIQAFISSARKACKALAT